MTVTTRKQQGFYSGTPAHTPPVLVSERALVPEGLLDGGEIVLLAVKPSLWFIVLRSAGWLIACALTSALAWYVSHQRIEEEWSRLVLQVSIAVGLIRISAAMFQWTSRLYVLTNRRVMRVQGVMHADVFECPLNKIQSTCLTLGPAERLLRIGTIRIETLGEPARMARWECLGQPMTVHTRLRNAIARSHMNGSCEP